VFLGCLKQQSKADNSETAERPEKLARDVMSTHKFVKEALDQHLRGEEGEKFIENALALPLPAQYRALLEGLRFDYMSMRSPTQSAGGSSSGTGDYVHHYKALAA
jgi:hypothetical protein